MKLSPLQLKHYFLTELALAINPAANPENFQLGANSIYPDLNCDSLESIVELSTDPEDKEHQNKFMIQLGLAYKESENIVFPYQFKAKIIGFFEIDHDGDLEERKRMVVVNGTGILYGILRDKFLSLSSQFMFGSIMLPAGDFRSLQKQDKDPKATKVKTLK